MVCKHDGLLVSTRNIHKLERYRLYVRYMTIHHTATLFTYFTYLLCCQATRHAFEVLLLGAKTAQKFKTHMRDSLPEFTNCGCQFHKKNVIHVFIDAAMMLLGFSVVDTSLLANL